MGTDISIILLVLISIYTSHVYSACMQGRLVSQITEYGNIDRYCVYKDMKFLPGSSFKIAAPDCLQCQCTKRGLQCCGFGFAAGIIIPPEDCIAYNDACNLVFVKVNNSSEICHQSMSTYARKKNRKLLTDDRT